MTGISGPLKHYNKSPQEKQNLSIDINGHIYTKEPLRSYWKNGLTSSIHSDSFAMEPIFLSIGGGKGGVGKSFVSSNIATKLAGMGFKVLIADFDLGGSNLHTYFGLPHPKLSIANFINSTEVNFEDIFLKTGIENLTLIAGGNDEGWSESTDLQNSPFVRLWYEFLECKKNYQFDFVIFDLGAGTHRYTTEIFSMAHMGIIVTLPEPTSIENAYAFLKATLWRIIDNSAILANDYLGAEEIKNELFITRTNLSNSYVRTLHNLKEKHTELVTHIQETLQGRKIGFIINQIRTQKDIDLNDSMATIAKNYFGYDTCTLGFLNYDDCTWKAIRNKRILIQDFPHAIVAKRITEINNQIIRQLFPKRNSL